MLERRVLTLAAVAASGKRHSRIYILQVCDEKKASFFRKQEQKISQILRLLKTRQKRNWPAQEDLDNFPRPPSLTVFVLRSQMYLITTSTKLSFTNVRKDARLIEVRLPFELKVQVRSYYYPAAC